VHTDAPTVSARQVLAPAAGSVEYLPSPPASTATQSDAEAHDSTLGLNVGLSGELLQERAPAAGSVLVNTFPAKSVAAQNDTDGHERLSSEHPPGPVGPQVWLLSRCSRLQFAAPPAGAVDVRRLPARSVATQRLVEGHAIVSMGAEGSTSTGRCQDKRVGIRADAAVAQTEVSATIKHAIPAASRIDLSLTTTPLVVGTP